MAGTKAGGKAAAETNKQIHGEDFYHNIGQLGGAIVRPETRYFHQNREAARIAGAKGGRKSKRKPRRWTGDDI